MKESKARQKLKQTEKQRQRLLQAAAERQHARLIVHGDRFVKAYVARFKMSYEDFQEYELVISEQWDEATCVTRMSMERKKSVILL